MGSHSQSVGELGWESRSLSPSLFLPRMSSQALPTVYPSPCRSQGSGLAGELLVPYCLGWGKVIWTSLRGSGEPVGSSSFVCSLQT